MSNQTVRITAFFLALALTAVSFAVEQSSAPAKKALELEDPLEPLTPQVQRTEAEEDRLESLSLFTTGRMLEQNRDHAGALRSYQRALRFDPTSVATLRQIVPLAFSLNRPDEALRYAVKLAELDSSDPTLLRRLAGVLAEGEKHEQAIAFYRKVIELEKSDAKSAEQVMLQMEIGRLSFLTKQYDQAAEAFSYVLAALDDPEKYGLEPDRKKRLVADGGVALELFAEAFLEAGRIDDAAKAYDKLNDLKEKPSVHAYHQARLASARGEHERALELLSQYIAADEQSKNTDPYRLLAKSLKALGREGELIERLAGQREKEPSDVWLTYALASAYRDAEQHENAALLYEELLASKPSVEAYQALLEIYRKTGNHSQLLKTLAQATAKAGSLEPFGSELDELVKDSETLDKLLTLARDAKSDESADPIQYRAAALLAIHAKKFDAAGELYDLAARKSEREELAQVLLVWGVELLRAEKYEDAAKVFQRGIDAKLLPEENPGFHFYLAGALELSGKTEEALKAARHAAERQPKSAQFASRIGWILYHAGRYDDAIAAYDELLKTFDENHTSNEVREVLRDVRLILSNLYIQKHDQEQAEEWLQQILDEFPDDVGDSNDLGYLWADAGKHLRIALRMARRAVAAEPENKAYRDTLGWVLFRLGQFKEAKAELELAIEGDAPDGVILEHLAEVQLKLGEDDRALETFRQALKTIEADANRDEKKIQDLSKRIKELEQSAVAAQTTQQN